jgi:hypothetical protein
LVGSIDVLANYLVVCEFQYITCVVITIHLMRTFHYKRVEEGEDSAGLRWILRRRSKRMRGMV